jgi:anaerobic ribonucleoside-triphosphate reductase activating protein
LSKHKQPEELAPSLGGWVPFSTVDWPGQLAAVVFIAGCPWRCTYCHNPHLQKRQASKQWQEVLRLLDRRRGLLDGVVFSGGEPLSEACLPDMIDAVKAMGYKVGLHTAGIYPRQLQSVLGRLDWVGLDVKTNQIGYAALTGRRFSATPVRVSLQLLLQSGCAFECRTTWNPSWLSETDLLDLAQELASLGVQNYAVQGERQPQESLSAVHLSVTAQERLGGLFSSFTWR